VVSISAGYHRAVCSLVDCRRGAVCLLAGYPLRTLNHYVSFPAVCRAVGFRPIRNHNVSCPVSPFLSDVRADVQFDVPTDVVSRAVEVALRELPPERQVAPSFDRLEILEVERQERTREIDDLTSFLQ